MALSRRGKTEGKSAVLVLESRTLRLVAGVCENVRVAVCDLWQAWTNKENKTRLIYVTQSILMHEQVVWAQCGFACWRSLGNKQLVTDVILTCTNPV